ncbi:MAG TPA: EthD family reductase [Candidatus Binataceae bacterium]|nr:EthD family reductase [Candidatus Binataceae bacterium]
MRTLFALFDFKSTDLTAEEQNYIGNHVRLARDLPGLRNYITGRLLGSKNHPAPYYRGAALNFDDLSAMRTAMRDSPVAKPLIDDGVEHLTHVRWIHLDSEVIVPFDAKPGTNCMLMAAEFDLKLNGNDYDAAESHYLNHHTHIARRMPGLRFYLIGRIATKPGVEPERQRMALLIFDSAEAGREAYRSPVGQELARDEEATIANPRVCRLDATVQI